MKVFAIFAVCCCLSCGCVLAQKQAVVADSVQSDPSSPAFETDSSQVKLRSFDPAELEQLRVDDDLDYRLPPTVAESLWDRLTTWLGWLFERIMRGAVETNWGRVFLYLLGLLVLVGVVMMVLRVDAIRVFYSGADRGRSPEVLLDNIHEMNFEEMMRDAVERKEFRMAVRLTFLHALKMLSDKHKVEWRPGKTNHDYVEELEVKELKAGFTELSFYFDYAWYGDFSVNEKLYQRVNLIFHDWKRNIR